MFKIRAIYLELVTYTKTEQILYGIEKLTAKRRTSNRVG
jgi:hypothetical protein